MSNFEMFQGEELIVTTDLTNIGSSQEDQTITLEIDGTQVDSQDVSVAAPSNGTEREQITLRWQSADDVSTGTRTVKVSSEDDTDTHDIGIVDISEAQFTVSVNSTNSPVDEGDTLTVDVDVKNTGDTVNAEPITLSIDNGIGQVDESDPVTVVPGNTKTVTAEWQTSDGDGMSSDYTATVESIDDSATANVKVDDVVPPGTGIDDFEDNDLVEYNTISAGGGTTTGQTVYEGNYSIGFKESSGNPAVASTSGLPNYPSSGDSFKYQVWVENFDEHDAILFFGYQDPNNTYRARIGDLNGTQGIHLRKVVNDTFTVLKSKQISNLDNYENEWLRAEIIWGSSGAITFRLLDSSNSLIEAVSETDTTYTSGGIGYGLSTGENSTSFGLFVDDVVFI